MESSREGAQVIPSDTDVPKPPLACKISIYLKDLIKSFSVHFAF